jgi:hypothetical protein
MARLGARKKCFLPFFTMSVLSSIASRCTVAASRFPAMAFVSSSSSSSSSARIRQLSNPLLFQQHRQQFNNWALSSSENAKQDEFEPTWTYVPHDPARKNQQAVRRPIRRPFSTWTVPKRVDIPEDQLDLSFTRASGSGGQNVNKVSTKVEMKLHVMEANFIPLEVRERLSTNQANRINKDGYMNVVSQEYRTQGQNRKAALEKLEKMILEAWPRPKVRKLRKGVSKGAKRRNKEFKTQRSERKTNRGRVDF